MIWGLIDNGLMRRRRWAATAFVHIVAIIMTAIMILHIRSKYTAVGEHNPGPAPMHCADTPGEKAARRSSCFSGCTPSLSSSPSSWTPASYPQQTLATQYVCFSLLPARSDRIIVVCCRLHGPNYSGVHMFAHQRLRGLPAGRRWHTYLIMGTCLPSRSAHSSLTSLRFSASGAFCYSVWASSSR